MSRIALAVAKRDAPPLRSHTTSGSYHTFGITRIGGDLALPRRIAAYPTIYPIQPHTTEVIELIVII